MSRVVSLLERFRLEYRPDLPEALRTGVSGLACRSGPSTAAVADVDAIRQRFPRTFGRPVLCFVADEGASAARPLNVGVVLSGGQAPGGHNVITGISDALSDLHPASRLVGFLGGPAGIMAKRHRVLTPADVAPYRNTGGFDMIGAGRDKIETEQHLKACRATCEALDLDGLVVIGGDDSNTNAAMLAEFFVNHDVKTAVVGVPKTIDGDMRGGGVDMSFGFDTATRVYAELIGNIARDAKSAGKYWHFIKLMGRNASHVALECALQTRVNVALIGEEVRERGQTLEQLVDQVADVVRRRAAAGRSYGVCLVPEGLIEFIPEIRALIDELNAVLQRHGEALRGVAQADERSTFIEARLTAEAASVFGRLPGRIRQQLLLERDSHGNVQVSKIDTEALLVGLVRQRLARPDPADASTVKFQVQHHFLGYEGRCAAPTNFDADYANALGHVAVALTALGETGYLAALQGLAQRSARWEPVGIPLTSLMRMEQRKGSATPVIGKALVRLDGGPFLALAALRERWALEDHYVYPGAIQYWGPAEVAANPSWTVRLEAGGAYASREDHGRS